MATIKVYIRFGKIPENERSRIYRGDEVLGEQIGVSVWECVENNYNYYLILPENFNKNTLSDYFDFLFSDKKVYLVTGQEMPVKGCDNEVLLREVKIIKELPNYRKIYNK